MRKIVRKSLKFIPGFEARLGGKTELTKLFGSCRYYGSTMSGHRNGGFEHTSLVQLRTMPELRAVSQVDAA